MQDDPTVARRVDVDQDWSDVAQLWSLREGVTYLNHGSFGPPARPVAEVRQQWDRRLDSQPMEVLVCEYEPAWLAARDAVAELVGAAPNCLGLVDNSTYAMNVVAHSFPLRPGDEVLLTDHEYGAVGRIWDRACRRQQAKCRELRLPSQLETEEQAVDAVLQSISPQTKLLVVSHITSPTALLLPVERIIEGAKARGVAVCVDGPHAVAQLPLNLDRLGCDFYTASCHKWLSAPFGTGFLYAAPRWSDAIEPPVLSWGRLPPQTPESWTDQLMWLGTRSPAATFTLPAAIQLLAGIGWEAFRQRTHWLAGYAAEQIEQRYGLPPIGRPFDRWYGSMAHCRLPDGEALPLQLALREKFQIETPVIDFADQRWNRVSCHLYNTTADIDRLLQGLVRWLSEDAAPHVRRRSAGVRRKTPLRGRPS